MRHPPNDGGRAPPHHSGMEKLRTTAACSARAAVARAALPSMVLAVAITLDQYTRGPSVSALVLNWLFA